MKVPKSINTNDNYSCQIIHVYPCLMNFFFSLDLLHISCTWVASCILPIALPLVIVTGALFLPAFLSHNHLIAFCRCCKNSCLPIKPFGGNFPESVILQMNVMPCRPHMLLVWLFWCEFHTYSSLLLLLCSCNTYWISLTLCYSLYFSLEGSLSHMYFSHSNPLFNSTICSDPKVWINLIQSLNVGSLCH